ncbi:hypothetical protein [Chryseobacterium aureum]|uniref:hypothetical protein n=1 Tax=Chryseobacterium aureum TaxID=2497456 RepID=UPI000F86B7DE|nr:hypothetical protein [Chryseobacterium aureum]
MITKKMVLEFHEQRLKSTVKIIEALRELKKTNLMTPLIDREIEMQEGERDFTNETLTLLKQEDNDNVIVLGETKCGEVIQGEKKGNEISFRIKGSDLLEVLDRVKEKSNIPDHRNPPNPPAK